MTVHELAKPELNARSEGARRRYARDQSLRGHLALGVEAILPAEARVLDAILRLGGQKHVAHELGISIQTVKNHVSTVLHRLEVLTVGQALVIYDRHQRGFASWPYLDRRHTNDRRTGGDRRQRDHRS